ncbi:MAG: flagellar basal body P-ring protein FlgI [Planctomycetaceae bacterium]|nr:flagellar basal body P-ring protein FlgI [Planctomycetaceae bacterium]MBT6155107.1 flagellar basal body P-ring protein FlgI [Planctomycetaceae bacterium]MBT6483377.1 flagellar basal body P-ring protein FlgI [Planctomycetaceae bacterium]MBT6493828.1 flagellar basal body P-ring protein FlgI [Planctomycetaceae bacterium]
MTNSRRWSIRLAATLLVAAAVLAVLSPRETAARVKLKDICSVSGEREVQLIGIGLVTGLDGTGGGGKDPSALKALAKTMEHMNAAIPDLKNMKNAKNFDIVIIHATIPKNGARRGQKIDCFVTSYGGAKDLRGGRLLPTPLETASDKDGIARGTASGGLIIEGTDSKVVGRIPGGVTLTDDFIHSFVDVYRGGVITLLLNESHASYQVAAAIARVINEENGDYSSTGNEIAQAVGPGVIDVKLPQVYRDSPVDFVGNILATGVDTSSTARVTVNNKSKVIIIDGAVEISPAVIAHKSLVVDIGGGGNTRTALFVGLESRGNGSQTTQQLSDLVTALKSLKVPPEDMISIIRELHVSGHLHAQYSER